jgi:hypothetical protein
MSIHRKTYLSSCSVFLNKSFVAGEKLVFSVYAAANLPRFLSLYMPPCCSGEFLGLDFKVKVIYFLTFGMC